MSRICRPKVGKGHFHSSLDFHLGPASEMVPKTFEETLTLLSFGPLMTCNNKQHSLTFGKAM